MTKHERDLLALRYVAIGDELEALSVVRGVDDMPADAKLALRVEQDEIEHRLGVETFERPSE